MATVLVATTAGAVAGPNLLAPGDTLGRVLGLPGLAGAYVIAAVCFAAAAGLLLRLPSEPPRSPASSATSIARVDRSHRDAGFALVVLALANLVMIAVMTMGPVHLHHLGVGLGPIGLMISLHIAGMFAPSPLSGWLTDRMGTAPATALAGAVLTTSALLATLGAESVPVLGVALVLLGVGWNLALVAGSTLLTAGTPMSERPRREGWGEVAMGVAAAGGGAASGVVVTGGGYALLAAGSAAVAALVVAMAWQVRTVREPQASDGAATPDRSEVWHVSHGE
jgi:MFS family permease